MTQASQSREVAEFLSGQIEVKYSVISKKNLFRNF